MIKEDLGTYESNFRDLRAELELKASTPDAYYFIKITFYRETRFEVDNSKVVIGYSVLELDKIFSRLKQPNVEEGIELLIGYSSELKTEKWPELRRVLPCILSLEEQVKPVVEQREKIIRQARGPGIRELEGEKGVIPTAFSRQWAQQPKPFI